MNPNFCPNCGVELEPKVKYCPLCGSATDQIPGPGKPIPAPSRAITNLTESSEVSGRKKGKIAFEIISLCILSSVIVTISVDYILNKQITWSEFPVAICLVIFSYISLLAFWNQRLSYVLSGGFILSAAILYGLDYWTGGLYWSLPFGIPVLFCVNVITMFFILAYQYSGYRKMNLIAYALIGIALYCFSIETWWKLFQYHRIHLFWSLIVAATLLPVSAVLLYIHYRFKKSNLIEKTFHI